MSGALDRFAADEALRDLVSRVEHAARSLPRSTALPERAALEATVRQVRQNDDLLTRFAQQARAAGSGVQVAAPGELGGLLSALVAKHAITTAFVEPTNEAPQAQPNATGPDAELREAAAALRRAGVHVQHDAEGDALFELDASITLASAGIAETGSIVCESGPRRPRGASLIPRVHIALLRCGDLQPDLWDLLATRDARDLPTNVNIITGPSKTADIEGVLITGVHGPAALEIVLMSDGSPR